MNHTETQLPAPLPPPAPIQTFLNDLAMLLTHIYLTEVRT